MADRQFVAPFGNEATPASWVLPPSLDIPLKTAYAAYDGTNATQSYRPCLRLISDSGHVVAEAVSEVIVAAGGSATVSWFPGAELEDETAGTTAGVTLEQLMLDTRSSTGITSSTVLLSGEQYVITVQGTYSFQNAALGFGSPNADAMFPTSGGVGRVSTQVGSDAETLFAEQSGPPSGMALGHFNWFQINPGSGWGHVEPQGGPFSSPQANYLYRYTVTGLGSTIGFRIWDNGGAGPWTDNYGYLQITIQGLGGSSGGGGGGALLPPSGADNSILKVASAVPFWQAQPAISDSDLTTSGVTAATYGDATHVAQVQVNSKGRVTSASNVAITAGSGITTLASPGSTIAVTNPTGPTADIDLPASGASAGTYGDATHVSQVTVNAEGIVTAVNNVAISGLSGSGLVLLFDSTLGADAASIDTGAGGVSTAYTELFIFCELRTKDAAVNGDCQFRFNNDSGTNYATSYIGSQSGTAPSHDTASGQTAANFWTQLGDSASSLANAYGTIVANIPNYAGTSHIKMMTVTAQMVGTGSATMFCKTGFSAWNSTAAISRIAVMAQSGANLKAGSRMTIYGT